MFGALVLTWAFAENAIQMWKPSYGSTSFHGVGGVFLLGIGTLVLGLVMPVRVHVRMLVTILFSMLVKRPPVGRGQVIPIDVATNSAGKPVKVGRLPIAIATAS